MSYPVKPAHINIYLKSKKGCTDFYNLLNVTDAEPSSKIKLEHEYNICSSIYYTHLHLSINIVSLYSGFKLDLSIVSYQLRIFISNKNNRQPNLH